MTALDTDVREVASPLDLWEMAILAWIRLVASTAHSFAALPLPQQQAAQCDPEKERVLAEQDELLLHVLE